VTSEGIVVFKFNPYHDKGGRFASGGGGGRTGDWEGAGRAGDLAGATTLKENVFGDIEDRLSADEKKALTMYQSVDPEHDWINGSLRGKLEGGTNTAETVAHLDSAMGKSNTDRDLVVYRGMQSKSLQNKFTGFGGKSFEPGQVFTDKGFVSTSLDRGVATSFAGSKQQPHGVVFEILVPKGFHALAQRREPMEEVAEVILPRNSKFRYVGVQKWVDAGKHQYPLVSLEAVQ